MRSKVRDIDLRLGIQSTVGQRMWTRLAQPDEAEALGLSSKAHPPSEVIRELVAEALAARRAKHFGRDPIRSELLAIFSEQKENDRLRLSVEIVESLTSIHRFIAAAFLTNVAGVPDPLKRGRA